MILRGIERETGFRKFPRKQASRVRVYLNLFEFTRLSLIGSGSRITRIHTAGGRKLVSLSHTLLRQARIRYMRKRRRNGPENILETQARNFRLAVCVCCLSPRRR